MKQRISKQRISSRRRWRLGKMLGVVLGAVLVVALGLPLLLRGPVVRAAFAQASVSRCGHFSLSGGHLGWAAVFQFALGRPFHVTLEGVSITAPDGSPVLKSVRVEASPRIRFFPLRIEVADALVSDGLWRFAERPDALSSSDAFRRVPAQGRAACLLPARPQPQSQAQRSSGGFGLVIERARLRNLDVDLDFATWGLALSHVRSDLDLTVGHVFRFAFTGAFATRGALRVGNAGLHQAAVVRFDSVAIDRAAVVTEEGTDLLLQVAGARTGRSTLLGQAVFHGIFPGSAPEAGRPGVDVDARWNSFGEALANLQAEWRPPRRFTEHLDGDLHVTLNGPFDDLRVMLDAEGKSAHARIDLAHDVADLRLLLRGTDTTWIAGPGLAWVLGGKLHGDLAARLRLASTFAQMKGEISKANLRLDRGPTSAGPQHVLVSIGGRMPQQPGGQRLSLSMRQVRLVDGGVHIHGVRLGWAGMRARAEATVALAEGQVEIVFPPPGQLLVGGAQVELPPRLVLSWNERTGSTIAPFRFKAGAEAYVEAAAHVTPTEALDGAVVVHEYPIASFPWLGSRANAADVRGTVSAGLALGGSVSAPSMHGVLRISSLAARGRPVPEVTASVALGPLGGNVVARAGGSLGAIATLRREPRPSISAEILMHKQALGPWLPRMLAGTQLEGTGRTRFSLTMGRPPVVNGTIELGGPGLTNVQLTAVTSPGEIVIELGGQLDVSAWPGLWSPYLAGAEGAVSVDLRARSPLHDVARPVLTGTLLVVRDLRVRLGKGGRPLALAAGGRLLLEADGVVGSGLRVDTPWFRGLVSGRVGLGYPDIEHTPMALSVAGTVDLSALPLPVPMRVRGTALLSADLHGALADLPGPNVHGELRASRVSVDVPFMPKLVLDGSIEADGDSLLTRALAVGVAGAGTIAIGKPLAPARMTVASLYPFRVRAVDVPFTGSDLVLGGRHAPVRIRDLDVDARLLGTPGALRLVGNVFVAGGVLDAGRAKKQSGPGSRPWYQQLPPGLSLDLHLRGPQKAMRVSVPVLPDVTVDFDCRLHATREAATLTGNLRGDSAYDRTAVDVYAWLSAKDVRHCRVD